MTGTPEGFAASFAKEEEKLARAVVLARELLPKIKLERRLEGFISSLCLENNVAGHRADLVIREAARALAAYQGRTEVDQDMIIRVAPLALLHRRRDPLPPPPPPPPEEEKEDQETEEPPETPPDDQDQEEEQDSDDLDEPFDLPPARTARAPGIGRRGGGTDFRGGAGPSRSRPCASPRTAGCGGARAAAPPPGPVRSRAATSRPP